MSLSSEDKLPRLSYELIDMLVDVYRHPEYPTTMSGWDHLDDRMLRMRAFQAGQASVVQALVLTKNEELSEYGEEPPGSPEEPTDLLGTPLFEQGRVVRTADALDYLDENDL